jgi:molybdopterin converting factor small subunit
MAKVTVRFNGIWRLYLGIDSVVIAADTVDEALAKIEQNYGKKFKEEWQKKGRKFTRNIIKYSYITVNRKNVRRLEDRSLKDNDIIDILLAVPGG